MANEPLPIKMNNIKNKNDKMIIKLFRTLQPTFNLLFHRPCTPTSQITLPAYLPHPYLLIFEIFEKNRKQLC